MSSGAPAQEAYTKARDAVDRALALSPDLASAHVARGYLLQVADFDWRGAEAEFRHALALTPNDGEAKFSLGTQLAAFGEVKQAIELTRQALATEPLRASWYYWLAGYFSGVNRLDEAEQAIRSAIELQPAAPGYRQQLTIIEIQRGDVAAALEAALQVASKTSGCPFAGSAGELSGRSESCGVSSAGSAGSADTRSHACKQRIEHGRSGH